MCDSSHDPVEDPLLEELEAIEAEVHGYSALLLRTIRRRDDLRRPIELDRRNRLLP
jgi:hypothetical protein